jgi:hypothetical protein
MTGKRAIHTPTTVKAIPKAAKAAKAVAKAAKAVAKAAKAVPKVAKAVSKKPLKDAKVAKPAKAIPKKPPTVPKTAKPAKAIPKKPPTVPKTAKVAKAIPKKPPTVPKVAKPAKAIPKKPPTVPKATKATKATKAVSKTVVKNPKTLKSTKAVSNKLKKQISYDGGMFKCFGLLCKSNRVVSEESTQQQLLPPQSLLEERIDIYRKIYKFKYKNKDKPTGINYLSKVIKTINGVYLENMLMNAITTKILIGGKSRHFQIGYYFEPFYSTSINEAVDGNISFEAQPELQPLDIQTLEKTPTTYRPQKLNTQKYITESN